MPIITFSVAFVGGVSCCCSLVAGYLKIFKSNQINSCNQKLNVLTSELDELQNLTESNLFPTHNKQSIVLNIKDTIRHLEQSIEEINNRGISKYYGDDIDRISDEIYSHGFCIYNLKLKIESENRTHALMEIIGGHAFIPSKMYRNFLVNKIVDFLPEDEFKRPEKYDWQIENKRLTFKL